MVNLLFHDDSQILRNQGHVRTLYDPACGTGGMLSVAEEYLRELNPDATLEVFGQDYNDEAFAICRSDMLIKGQNPENIKFGDSFTQDGLPGQKFDYLLANPPFGVEWKPQADVIEREHASRASTAASAPACRASMTARCSSSAHDLQDEAEKARAWHRLQRLAAVHRRRRLGREQHSPLDHRERLAGGDHRPADRVFYNTGISTYIWIVTNRKRRERRGKVQLINAVTSS